MLFIIGISIVVGDSYPLSTFPMFSKIGNKRSYVYITSSDNQVIPLRKKGIIGTQRLYKYFNLNVKYYKSLEEESKYSTIEKKAALKTLTQILELCSQKNIPLSDKSFKLWKGTIFLENGYLKHEKRILGELSIK